MLGTLPLPEEQRELAAAFSHWSVAGAGRATKPGPRGVRGRRFGPEKRLAIRRRLLAKQHDADGVHRDDAVQRCLDSATVAGVGDEQSSCVTRGVLARAVMASAQRKRALRTTGHPRKEGERPRASSA